MKNIIGPLKIDLSPPQGKGWRSRASNLAEWEAWDRSWRKRLGWRAGLNFWSKTNQDGARVLISRHWPHRLCWSWMVWVSRNRPGYEKNRIGLVVVRPYRVFNLMLWKWRVSFHWQDSDYMVGLGHYKNGAPKIYWKHQLERAEPAGSA